MKIQTCSGVDKGSSTKSVRIVDTAAWLPIPTMASRGREKERTGTGSRTRGEGARFSPELCPPPYRSSIKALRIHYRLQYPSRSLCLRVGGSYEKRYCQLPRTRRAKSGGNEGGEYTTQCWGHQSQHQSPAWPRLGANTEHQVMYTTSRNLPVSSVKWRLWDGQSTDFVLQTASRRKATNSGSLSAAE